MYNPSFEIQFLYIHAKIHGMSLICELQQNHLLSELMFQN